METRRLGRTGIDVGVIGLGIEHMNVSRDNMDAVIDLLVSAGGNFIDLVYNDPIDSHAGFWEAIAPALRRHRDSLVFCVHWGFIQHEPIDRCHQCFEEVLRRLGGAYTDIAMVTLVDSESLWKGWAQDSLQRLRQLQKNRHVGYLGLSNHNIDVARMAAESGLIDVLMFPVNLYQHHGNQERGALLETCAEKGVGVVAMKPYYGGRLLTTEGRATGISPVQCLHYVLSQPVATIAPGCQNAEEMRQALGYVDASEADKEHTHLHDELTKWLHGQCVRCQHCLPCPQEINIPAVIMNLDYVEHYGHGFWSKPFNRGLYASLPAKGSDCTGCGVCVERCPFEVDIIGKMRRAAEVLETGN